VISYPVKRKDGSHLPWDDDITVTAVIERHLIDANLLSVCHSALLAVLSDPIVAAGMLGVLDAFFCSHLRRVLWARLHRNCLWCRLMRRDPCRIANFGRNRLRRSGLRASGRTSPGRLTRPRHIFLTSPVAR
jgi:hypothetical protein